MADFVFVTDRLATGAAISTPADVEQLVAAKITAIIDCRAEFDDTPLLANEPRLTYLWDGTADDGQPKPVSWFKKGIDFALDKLSRPYEKVYCHCAAGVNRGPSMCYAIMLAQGWSTLEAEYKIKGVRPQAQMAYKADADKAVLALGYE